VNREFVALLVLANLIAWPLAHYVLNRFWLEQFPYRTDLTAVPFLVAGAIGLAVTLLATLYHSVSAARTNPALSLRYE
jgi:putative ABC transport system permease protein